MNIFHKVALQTMRKSRTRTIVTIIGVILSSALITSVATFGTSLLNYLINSSAAKYGSWHVEFLDVDSAFAQKLSHDRAAADTAVFENMGYAMLEGGKSPEKPYLFIAGFNDMTFDTLPISLITGRLPENSGEILIPSHIAAKGGVRFKVGDTLSLAVGNRMKGNRVLGQHDPYTAAEEPAGNKEILVTEQEKDYIVAGICQRPGFEEHSAPGYTVITKKDTVGQDAGLNLFVTLKNPREAKAFAENAAGSQPYLLNDYVLRFMGVSDNELFNTLAYTVGAILTAIIMLGSFFLIFNSFSISLSERTKQFGILSSVGATSRQLRNSVLFEGLCIGAVGIPIGIAAGIGSVCLIIPVVAGNFSSILNNTVPLTLSVSFPAIAAASALSLVTIPISAYIPAKRAASVPVMDNIRQSNTIRIRPEAVRISGLSQKIFGFEGILALKNFKRNRKRYRSIVLSLTLSVVLFVSGNAFGTTLKRISELYVTEMDHDILFTAYDMEDSEVLPLFNRLMTAKGAYEGSYQTVLPYSCTVQANDFSGPYREYEGYADSVGTVELPMDIQFIEDREYLDFIKELGLPAEEYTGLDGKIIAVAKKRIDRKGGPDELLNMFAVPSMTCQVAPVKEGGQLSGTLTGTKTMSEAGQSVTLTFADTYPVDPPPKQDSKARRNPSVFMAVAPYSLKEKFEAPDIPRITGMGCLSGNPSQSETEMEAMLQDQAGIPGYTLYNIDSILEQYRSAGFVIDVFTYVFVIMISLIAAANVFNTISTNIRLRRRELAMLRSVGMSERDFNKMMNFECVFYGMRTLLSGLPISGAASWLIFKGLTGVEKIDSLAFEFPWKSMAVSVAGVLFIVFITMLYSVRRIKRENIIDALRDDMT